MKINGSTVGTTTPRADWQQDNPRKADYIKNKPIIDQNYNPESENAQSGKAVAEAISNIEITVENATNTKAGVVAFYSNYGVTYETVNNNSVPKINKANENEINDKKNNFKPIVPANLEYAVKSVAYDKAEIDTKMGDVETALDSIIAIQESLIGGDSV